MTKHPWVSAPVREFESLAGARVVSWTGIEMALREDVAGNGPQFTDPAVPCLQLFGLQVSLDDGTGWRVETYQDDLEWGLCAAPAAGLTDDGTWDGIYRVRSLTELPLGLIDEVAVFADEDVLAEVSLRVGGQPLLLIAGELYECAGGALDFARLDESVLVFTDPVAADDIPWSSTRQRSRISN